MKQDNDSVVTAEKDSVTYKSIDAAYEVVVISDECGDSLWDAILVQEEKKPAGI